MSFTVIEVIEIQEMIISEVADDVRDAGFVVINEDWSSESYSGREGILIGLTTRSISRLEVVMAFGDHFWFDDIDLIYRSGHVALVNRK